MYMIHVGGTASITGINKTASNDVYLPAERCSWNQEYSSDRGYYITEVYHWPGDDTSLALTGTGIVLELGYISKTGRFVAITG